MQTDRSNAGILTGGALLTAVGLLTMTGQWFRAVDWNSPWPLLLIVLGTILLIGTLLGKKRAGWLAIPACMLGCIGLGTFIYSLTHHWKLMFYFWTLLISFTGAGISIMGWKTHNPKQKLSGLRLMEAGLMLFITLGTFFELLFSSMIRLAFPSLLVTAGLCILLSQLRRLSFRRELPTNLVSPVNVR